MKVNKKLLVFLILLVATGFALYKGLPIYLKTQALSRFSQETTKSEFISYMTEVNGTTKLQVAELNQMEILTQESRKRVFWNKLELPPIVVSLEVPVSYTYVVDLSKDWSIDIQSGVMQVVVPNLEFNRPAPDVSAMKFNVQKTSVFRNENQVKSRLAKELTPYLYERAQEQVSLVRETSRSQVVKLIEKWASLQSTEPVQVKVLFQDELSEQAPTH